MPISNYGKRIIAQLKALPEGTILHWTSPMTGRRDQALTWLDVDIPELSRPLGGGWVCTVVAPTDSDAAKEDPFTWVACIDSDEGWSASRVSRELSKWVQYVTGRRDLLFSYEEIPKP